MRNPPRLAKVDSEIAITALLAAAVSGFPLQEEIYPLIKGIAIGLLGLALVKRISILNGLTFEDTPLRILTYIMDPASYIAFLYLCYVTTQRLIYAFSDGLFVELRVFIFSLVSVGGILTVFVGSQLILGASLKEGERIFEASSEKHQGEALGLVLRQISLYVAASRRPNETITYQSRLTDGRFTDRDLEDLTLEEQTQIAKSILVMIAGLGIALLGYIGIAALGVYYFKISWFSAASLLVAVLIVSAFFRIWYSHYGLARVEERNGYMTFLGEFSAFVVTGLMIF